MQGKNLLDFIGAIWQFTETESSGHDWKTYPIDLFKPGFGLISRKISLKNTKEKKKKKERCAL